MSGSAQVDDVYALYPPSILEVTFLSFFLFSLDFFFFGFASSPFKTMVNRQLLPNALPSGLHRLLKANREHDCAGVDPEKIMCSLARLCRTVFFLLLLPREKKVTGEGRDGERSLTRGRGKRGEGKGSRTEGSPFPLSPFQYCYFFHVSTTNLCDVRRGSKCIVATIISSRLSRLSFL